MAQLKLLGSSSVQRVRRKRRKEELIARILMGAGNGASKTRIMYFSCVNYPRLQKYIAIAQGADLICIQNNRFSTTEKGMEYLKHFQEFKKSEKQIINKKRILDELLKNGNTNARYV